VAAVGNAGQVLASEAVPAEQIAGMSEATHKRRWDWNRQFK